MLPGVVKLAAETVDLVRRPPRGLVVLLYHRVGGRTPVTVDLTVAAFDDQIAELAETTTVLTLDEAVERLAAREDLAGCSAVTFDDGTADLVDEALPVLERHRVPATVYVATAHVEDRRPFPDAGEPVSWSGLAECVAGGLVTVGSHTHTHVLLDRLPATAIADELDRSIDLIGERLGVRADHFAYPKALAPSAAADAAVRARFRSAALAGTRANPIGSDVHRLTRSPVQTTDGARWFRRKLHGGMALEDDLRRLANRRRYSGASA